jgi:CheY-like chemotaxis protein
MNYSITRSVEILMVEDNPGDARLTQEAFKQGKLHNHIETNFHINIVKDGTDALEFLYQQGSYQDAPRPDLILLDLNLPRTSGFEVLAAIKPDPNLRCIPVAILTTSEAHKDIIKAYELHANCYITKPIDLEQFLEAVKAIESFWLTTVKLPPT